MNDFPINIVTAQTPFIGLAHGLIGVLLFRLKNYNKDYINLVSAFTLTIFISEIFFFKVNETSGLIIWAISGLGLLTTYGLRFKSKKQKEVIDYLKLTAIGLVICYPINFYTQNWYLHKWDILIAFGDLIVPISGTIYFYDRWILKPEQMKRKFVTILVIQTILILVALTYGFVKNAEKVRMTELADENAKKAIELSEKLENCR